MHVSLAQEQFEQKRKDTKTAAEMLVRRWFQTLSQLIEEYGLSIDVTLVRSEQNRAKKLTTTLPLLAEV